MFSLASMALGGLKRFAIPSLLIGAMGLYVHSLQSQLTSDTAQLAAQRVIAQENAHTIIAESKAVQTLWKKGLTLKKSVAVAQTQAAQIQIRMSVLAAKPIHFKKGASCVQDVDSFRKSLKGIKWAG